MSQKIVKNFKLYKNYSKMLRLLKSATFQNFKTNFLGQNKSFVNVTEPLIKQPEFSAMSESTNKLPATSSSMRNCDDVYNSGNGSQSNGIFTIYTGVRFVDVFCEFGDENKNWMVKYFAIVYIVE